MNAYTFELTELYRIEQLKLKLENRERMEAEGFVHAHAWVHPHQLNDLIVLIHALQGNQDFMVGPVRSIKTFRLHKLR